MRNRTKPMRPTSLRNRRRAVPWWLAGTLLPGLLWAWGGTQPSPAEPEAGWTAALVRVLEGFRVPECVVVNPANGTAYVSNIEAAEGANWTDDGKGFISRLKPGGELDVLRWKDSSRAAPLNAPKGMCLLKNSLYVADNTRVVCYSLRQETPRRTIAIPGCQRLNDMATDGEAVYVSDTGAGKVYRLDPQGPRAIKAPEMVNGITFFKGQMFAVGWSGHDLYELDPSGQRPPKAFGLAAHFTNLDGIEVLEEGTFLVSDFVGNKVCTISPDRKTVRTILQVESPADIGLDRQRNLLFVPQFTKDRVAVYRLNRDEG